MGTGAGELKIVSVWFIMEERQQPLNPGGIEEMLGVWRNWIDSNVGTVAT
jgi:hypothetical protein